MNSIFRIEVLPSAERDLKHIPRPARQELIAAINSLAVNPRPFGYKPLQTKRRLFRVRAGVYRVIYAIEPERATVVILRAGHRRSVYRNL